MSPDQFSRKINYIKLHHWSIEYGVAKSAICGIFASNCNVNSIKKSSLQLLIFAIKKGIIFRYFVKGSAFFLSKCFYPESAECLQATWHWSIVRKLELRFLAINQRQIKWVPSVRRISMRCRIARWFCAIDFVSSVRAFHIVGNIEYLKLNDDGKSWYQPHDWEPL